MHFWHSQYIPLQGKSNIWTARGKTFLNLVGDTCRHLLAFLALNYLSNSQRSVFMMFTSLEALTFFLNCSKLFQNVKALYVCRQGKNNFDPGDLHLYTPVPKKIMKIPSTITKLQSYEAHAQIPLVLFFKTFNRQL